MSSTTRDRDGRLVRVGSRVRLLRIVPWLLKIIPEEEKSDRLSMVGEIFEVQAIEDGRAHLEKWLNSSPTSFTAYAYDAEAHEIEFAKRSDGPANPQNAPRPEWPLTRRRKWAAYIAKSVTDKSPRQRCKHCGAEVPGFLTSGGVGPFGPGRQAADWTLLYEFICTGRGHHGKNDSGRRWQWTESFLGWRAARKARFPGPVLKRRVRRRAR